MSGDRDDELGGGGARAPGAGEGPDGDDRHVAARLAGIDGPRPLPSDLDDELVALLAADDPVGGLAASGAVGLPVDLPADLRERLEASVAGTAAVDDRRTVLPIEVRRRLTRALSSGWSTRTGVLRAAAVVVAVLLVAGGLAFAAQDRGEGSSTDLATETAGADDHGGGIDRLPGIDDPSAVGAGGATDPATGGPVEAGATTTTAPPAAPRPRRPSAPVPPPAGDNSLVAYASCDDLLGRTKASALEVVGPYGLEGGPYVAAPDAATADGRAGPAPSRQQAGAVAATAGAEGGASTTNVQEEGVDEPDIVKSDGRRIVTLNERTLRVSRDDGGTLTVLGALVLPQSGSAESLLVDGDRALVFGSGWKSDTSATGTDRYRLSHPQAMVWTIDLRDPAALKVETTLLLDGRIAAARLVGRRVRIALTSTAVGPDWVYPSDGSNEAQQRALEENRRLVRESSVEDWLPSYTLLRGTDSATARTGRLCACDDTLRPEASFAGVSTLSVLTLDPQRPDDPPAGSNAVQGWAETVYASRTNLFVTTRAFATRFQPGAPTSLHRFDITDPAAATYRGSGEVRGYPLNQFALSERGGHLRIATTDTVDGGSTESFVHVLALRDDRLEPVGQVGNLGKGERIFAVRFLDDVGYVVTFRQTDPLYTVDLSDPAKPTVRGELKIPGFSAYLHPVGGGRLVGVGQDATEDGRTTGAQVTSFDVRDITQPREVAKVGYGTGSATEAQRDHHAFLFWAAARRAMVPVSRYEYRDDTTQVTSWLSVIAVPEDGRIHETGTVTHDGRPSSSAEGRPDRRVIRRSFVVGATLYSLSASGILASDLQTLADRSWVAFDPAA